MLVGRVEGAALLAGGGRASGEAVQHAADDGQRIIASDVPGWVS